MSERGENLPSQPIPAEASPTEIIRDAFDLTAEPNATTRSAPAAANVPERVGRYTIREVIASGGMGTVYHAVQEQPRRTVALKVMKTGITSRSALRRFEFEAQTLARLRHPNVAHVYEAGTHDDGRGGVPFFAMEYVPGAKSLTNYAEASKLGTRERLELFAKVCDAVHHGHQKGIIHRDLKPSNILVDSGGEPKIIDFGVARATDSDLGVTTRQTEIGQLIGTLQYMSPEQCDGDPEGFDIRSDVYALGVVLYELLCGRMPYDVSRAAIPEAVRVIKEESPKRPSAADRRLRGDVETIILKALEKEPERRYESAADLGQDIHRHLVDDPVEAMPASFMYRLNRFVKKNHSLLSHSIVAVICAFSVLPTLSNLLLRTFGIEAKVYELVYLIEFLPLGLLALCNWWISRTKDARLAACLAVGIGLAAMALWLARAL